MSWTGGGPLPRQCPVAAGSTSMTWHLRSSPGWRAPGQRLCSRGLHRGNRGSPLSVGRPSEAGSFEQAAMSKKRSMAMSFLAKRGESGRLDGSQWARWTVSGLEAQARHDNQCFGWQFKMCWAAGVVTRSRTGRPGRSGVVGLACRFAALLEKRPSPGESVHGKASQGAQARMLSARPRLAPQRWWRLGRHSFRCISNGCSSCRMRWQVFSKAGRWV